MGSNGRERIDMEIHSKVHDCADSGDPPENVRFFTVRAGAGGRMEDIRDLSGLVKNEIVQLRDSINSALEIADKHDGQT